MLNSWTSVTPDQTSHTEPWSHWALLGDTAAAQDFSSSFLRLGDHLFVLTDD
jgi:hypothetical protein